MISRNYNRSNAMLIMGTVFVGTAVTCAVAAKVFSSQSFVQTCKNTGCLSMGAIGITCLGVGFYQRKKPEPQNVQAPEIQHTPVASAEGDNDPTLEQQREAVQVVVNCTRVLNQLFIQVLEDARNGNGQSLERVLQVGEGQIVQLLGRDIQDVSTEDLPEYVNNRFDTIINCMEALVRTSKERARAMAQILSQRHTGACRINSDAKLAE